MMRAFLAARDAAALAALPAPPRFYPGAVPRRPGEPAPDLSDYRIVHRAMTVDLDRLAVAAAELVDRPDPARLAALRHYLHAVSGEIESHHQVEDEHIWPLLAAVAADPAGLAGLSDDHERLDPLLRRARELTGAERATWELATVLREASDLLTRHVVDKERVVFELIADHVRVADYQRLQRSFRENLTPRLLPFLMPWTVRHATAEERPHLLASAGAPMRLLLRLVEGRFRAREALLFGA